MTETGKDYNALICWSLLFHSGKLQLEINPEEKKTFENFNLTSSLTEHKSFAIYRALSVVN